MQIGGALSLALYPSQSHVQSKEVGPLVGALLKSTLCISMF